jgi:hypothetical protein
MARLSRQGGGSMLLIGLEAFIPPGSPTVSRIYPYRGLEGGAWYLVRHADATYDLH